MQLALLHILILLNSILTVYSKTIPHYISGVDPVDVDGPVVRSEDIMSYIIPCGTKFACSVCGHTCTRKHDVKRHFASAHSSADPPIECEHCGKVSKNMRCLKAHIKQIHGIY